VVILTMVTGRLPALRNAKSVLVLAWSGPSTTISASDLSHTSPPASKCGPVADSQKSNAGVSRRKCKCTDLQGFEVGFGNIAKLAVCRPPGYGVN